MPHRDDIQPPHSPPPSRTGRVLWFAGLLLGVTAGAVVALQLASLGGH